MFETDELRRERTGRAGLIEPQVALLELDNRPRQRRINQQVIGEE